MKNLATLLAVILGFAMGGAAYAADAPDSELSQAVDLCSKASKSAHAQLDGSQTACGEKTADPCIQVRAAFDVGSSATKIKVAKVDTCLQKVEAILLDESAPVGYKQDLSRKESDGAFSEDIQAKGLAVLAEFKEKAAKFNPRAYSGVATSAFRKAKNGTEYLAKVKEKLGISVQKISQDREGELGFIGGASLASSKLEQTLVWDMGGDSMQISYLTPDRKIGSHGNNTASVTFKNIVMEKVKKISGESPNPMTEDEIKKTIELGQAEAAKIPSSLKGKLSSESMSVVGIGGVFYGSLKKQMGRPGPYTAEEIEKKAFEYAGKTDEQIGGKYANTDLTNMALIAGLMKGLGLKKFQVFDVNLADGTLVSPEYWR